MQAPGRRRWANVATLVLLLHALAIAGRLAWKEGRRVGRSDLDGPEAAARSERFRALAAALPPSGEIGYLDAPRATSGSAHFDALQHPELQQLQYALAPRLLVAGTRHPVVVVAHQDAAAARTLAAAHRLRVVHDVGGGLLVTSPEATLDGPR